MKCDRCGAILNNKNEIYKYAGQNLCEDCYLDFVSTPKTCDPWAVHSAKGFVDKEKELTLVQKNILDLLKNKGPLDMQEICRTLGINENEFKTNFAILRHMELARACKVKNKICYTLFRD